MLTCADCKEVDCAQIGTDQNACDNFNGEEQVEQKTWGSEVLDAIQMQVDNQRDTIIGLCNAVNELQRKFDTIIAAVVKASGPEEER